MTIIIRTRLVRKLIPFSAAVNQSIKPNRTIFSVPRSSMAHLLLRLALLLLSATLCFSQVPAGPCVQYFNPPGAISVTGTWSIQTNILSDDCVPIHIAGMRGIFPGNNTQVPIVNAPGGLRPRILQAFENMLFEAASQGAGPADCAEVIVYVSDMVSIRPLVNSVQAQLYVFTVLTCHDHAHTFRRSSLAGTPQALMPQFSSCILLAPSFRSMLSMVSPARIL